MPYERRRKALQSTLESGEAFLVSSLDNIRYLSGFTGSSALLLLTPGEELFLTDFRYLTQVEEEVKSLPRLIYKRQLSELAQAVRSFGARRLKFEAGHLSYQIYESLAKELERFPLVPTREVVEELRHIKDSEELSAMRRAIEIAVQAWEETVGFIAEGASEREVALELEFQLKGLGSERTPFDLIVASGPRGALPHAQASDKVIRRGELVTVDFGACADGYFSDLTRTVPVGAVEEKLIEVYEVVLRANRAGIEAVRPGVKAGEIDDAARSVIQEAGYGENFGHGTGHGLGLEVHEPLRIAEGQERELEPGMVFTVEPGIYLPGIGGVRIEDMTLVTPKGVEILTAAISKDLVAIA